MGRNNNNKEQKGVVDFAGVVHNENFPRSSRFQPDPNKKPKFSGSLSILHAVVHAINTKIFCNNFDDIELEWCDKLVTRKAVTYKIVSLTTTKTYIRLSKTWFEGATRKQLVETVLYELLHLYLTAQARTSEENDLQVYLLSCAMHYLNSAFEMDLKINYNFDVAQVLRTSDGGKKEKTQARNNDNDLPIVMGLLGGSMCEAIQIPFVKRDPIVRIMNTKLIVKNQDQFECKKECCPCYCAPQLTFRERFSGAVIYAIFAMKPDAFNCILCDLEVECGKLADHFDKDCMVFKVSQVIHDKLNV